MVVLRSVVDTLVYQARTKTSYAERGDLQVRGSGDALVSYVQFTGIPSGPSVQITSAILEVNLMRAWSGATSTVTAKRVTSKWIPSTTTWDNAPTHTTTGSVTTSVPSGTAVNAAVQFDITAFVQAWATGTPNYGVRLDTASSAIQYFYASEALVDADLKPTLTITYTAAPSAPTALSPANGQQVSILRPYLTWLYPSGLAGPMTAYQLQVNDSDVWTAPDHDTGEVAATSPMHQLDFDAVPGLFWRVRHKSGADWSAWSATATFGYTAKPTLTITDPADGASATDSTPTIVWALDSGTQTHYQVIERRGSTVLLDSGVQAGATDSFTSTLALNYSAGDVTAEVHVFDDVDRASTPGDPPYIVATSTFDYQPDGEIEPAANLTVSADPVMPVAQLSWERSEIPDSWTILRNDVPVLKVDGIALEDGTDTYSWTDTAAPPLTELEYAVVAGENGVDAADPPTGTITLTPSYIWLLDPAEPDWWLALADQDQLGFTFGDSSEVFAVRGADRMVLVAEQPRGYEGTVSGGIYESLPGLGGLSAQSLRDRVWHAKRNPTRVFRFIAGDMNIPVVIRNLNVVVQPQAELRYKASFEAYQQGELPWS